MIGKSISHYQVLEKLGAGGMGVVWKARDARLNRIVALKMLPPDWHDSPERRQRFLYEAQAASALSHLHIVTVHDIVTHDGADFIVMEHVSGKTLDALIPRKGMRLTEALRIAVQIADALSAAHRAGIIHRDLKPGNIMVSDSGAVKVLDFGLAKAAEQNPGAEDALTRTVAPRTMDGVAVGTAGYMSPEQATARPVDARTDIFSFGALLYEMVTGERAFTGDTYIDTLAAVLHKEPAAMPSNIPAELQRVIARCLRKEPQRRFQHMDDLMVALQELRDESESGTPAVSATLPAAGRSSRKWVALGAAAATVIIIAAAVWWLTRGAATETALAATEVPLTSYPGIQHSPSFSPDGNQVAFSWNGEKQENYDIYVKLIGSPSPLRLTSDEAIDSAPAFSPDGRAIAFIREGNDRNLLIVVPPIGGPERVITELPRSVRQFSWLPGGKAVIVSGLTVVSIDDGEIKPLHTVPENTTDLKPAVAPNGRAVAFARGNNVGDIYMAGIDGAGNLTETPRRLTTSPDSVHGIAWTADSAALVVDSGPAVAPANLWRIGVVPAGPPKELPFGRGGGRRSDPAGQDGSTVAIARTGNRLVYCRAVQNVNLWLAAPATPAGMPARFLPSTRVEINPAYSPDGKRVVFHSTRSGKPGLWVGDVSGGNAAELFVPQRGHAGSPSWSPDGQTIVFDWNDAGRFQIYAIRASGGKPHRLTNDPASDTIPNWSGDGKSIYFTSTRSGRPEIWKIPASGGAAVQVTRNSGMLPRESPDGRFVYYLKNGGSGGIWRTPVTGQGNDETQIVPSTYRRHFALSARGIYFVSAAGEDGKHTLGYVPFEGGKLKTILTLPRVPVMGLAVSPDGGSLLYSQVEQISQELALVENFK